MLPHGPDGYVYVADTHTDTGASALKAARTRSVVRNASGGPPWIVVSHSLDSVVVARWPGRLLRVEIIEPATKQPAAYANYTRAVAVSVVAEVPAIQLFGQQGEKMAEILYRSAHLTFDEAVALSAANNRLLQEIYSQAWNAWLAEVDPQSPHLGGDHGGTLQIFAGRQVSPVGYALTLIYHEVSKKAESVPRIAGATDESEGAAPLGTPWQGAVDALLNAAMALGAPQLLTSEQAATMTAPWRTVMEIPTPDRLEP